MTALSAQDARLVGLLQDGIEVCDEPFRPLAEATGEDVPALLARLQRLLDDGVLSRFGPMYDAARMGGAFSLCAMQVPADRFDEVASQVNAHPQVAHNYQREHDLNMWFVLACERAADIEACVRRIEQQTGLTVVNLPKQREFFIGLRLTP